MNIEEITKKWLSDRYNEPLPEGFESKFGITFKTKYKYDSLEHMEKENMEHFIGKYEPFAYTEVLKYPEKKKNFQPTDEFWKLDDVIYVIRNNSIVLKEYRTHFSMPFGTMKTFKQPDPDFYIDLNGF